MKKNDRAEGMNKSTNSFQKFSKPNLDLNEKFKLFQQKISRELTTRPNEINTYNDCV
jgi:hypothetical protein